MKKKIAIVFCIAILLAVLVFLFLKNDYYFLSSLKSKTFDVMVSDEVVSNFSKKVFDMAEKEMKWKTRDFTFLVSFHTRDSVFEKNMKNYEKDRGFFYSTQRRIIMESARLFLKDSVALVEFYESKKGIFINEYKKRSPEVQEFFKNWLDRAVKSGDLFLSIVLDHGSWGIAPFEVDMEATNFARRRYSEDLAPLVGAWIWVAKDLQKNLD